MSARTISHSRGNFLSRLRNNRHAVGAVEFALIAPFMILLYVGSYQLMDAISAYRKVTITAKTLADLTTQSEQLSDDEAQSIIDGARQVMAPYSTADATLVIAQLKIDKDGNPAVSWSKSNDGTVAKVDDLKLPEDIAIPNSYIVYSQIIFHYHPKIAGSLIGPLTFSDHIFMNPRRSDQVCLIEGGPNSQICTDGATA